MLSEKSLEVWYIAPFTRCNFRCRYCASYTSYDLKDKESSSSGRMFQKVIDWLYQLPFNLKIRMNASGEPFLSSDFLKGVSFLSKSDHVEFIEIVTNGSFSKNYFESFARGSNVNKISLWITFHHEQIAPERLLDTAKFAQDLGAFVVVNILLFPDSLEVGLKMVGLCKKFGIRTDCTLGSNYCGAYPTDSDLPFLDSHFGEIARFYRHKAALAASIIGYLGPKGYNCSAGHDYIVIENNGDVYPCAPYECNPSNKLGNFLGNPKFVPRLRPDKYAPCFHAEHCGCKEDFLHLEVVRSQLDFGPSLGYYFDPQNKDTIVHVGDCSPDALKLFIVPPEDENKVSLICRHKDLPIEIQDNKMYIFLKELKSHSLRINSLEIR